MKAIKGMCFWALSLTWGAVLTLPGILVGLSLLCTAHKPKRLGPNLYFEAGDNWGGFNMGAIFICNKAPADALKRHETGHGIQNIIYGPLMLFIVAIPSVVRYWRRRNLLRSGRKTSADLPPYDSIWFESQATKLGDKYYAKGANKPITKPPA